LKPITETAARCCVTSGWLLSGFVWFYVVHSNHCGR